MPLLQPTIHFQIHPLQTYSADAKSLCCTGSKSSFPFLFILFCVTIFIRNLEKELDSLLLHF